MLAEGNFLLLDEPTNHLDMISKEVLENALRHYTGTLFFISHDRYFINRVANKVLELSSEGARLYHGNYDYYLEKKAQETSESAVVKTSVSSQNKKDWLTQKEEQKNIRMLENKLSKLEDSIDSLETRIGEIDEDLTLEEVYQDYNRSKELLDEKDDLESQLEEVMEEWEVVSKELDGIYNQVN